MKVSVSVSVGVTRQELSPSHPRSENGLQAAGMTALAGSLASLTALTSLDVACARPLETRAGEGERVGYGGRGRGMRRGSPGAEGTRAAWGCCGVGRAMKTYG